MSLDWSLLETFLRVAELGSSSAAAARLGISQPTISRRVAALEQELGVTLFVRHARGLSLTEGGMQLMERARGLDSQVDDIVRRATGMREVPRGEVRVSVNEPVGLYVLTPALDAFHSRFPDIQLELIIDNRSADLSRREADIAVRMFEPRGADLIAKRLGEVALGLFASPRYIEQRGLPKDLSDRTGHVLIGMDRDADWLHLIRSMGLSPQDFALRTDSLAAQFEAMRAGVGIGGTHLCLGEQFGLVRVMEWLALGSLPVWLVSHAELRTSAAVRSVHAFVEATLKAYLRAPRHGDTQSFAQRTSLDDPLQRQSAPREDP